jgi:choline monooxygenase
VAQAFSLCCPCYHAASMDLSDYKPTPDLSRAATIPARWYLDPRFLDLEKARVFGRSWQAVGHASQVAEPGSYLACKVADEPVVIARAKDGVLRGFSNVCRHRAAIVAEGCGRAASLRCPYHAWTYGLDGRLLSQPEFEGVEGCDKSAMGLPEYRVETWGPYLFVNLGRATPALAEVLGDIPREAAQLGCDFSKLQFSQRRDYVLECNWKVYVDNYLEGYHLPAAHPGLFRELDYQKYRVDTFRYYSSQYAPIRARSAAEGRRRYDYGQEGPNALYYWVFPNFMLNIYPDNMSANIIVPLGPEKTLTIFEWFAYSGGIAEETVAFSDEIQQEDIKVCESVQRGLASRSYTAGRFSVKRENGVHHFHLLLHEFLSYSTGL